MARRIDGILFDLGDTLLDFGQVDILSLFEAGARLAYDYLRQIGHAVPTFAKYHRQQLWAVRWSYLKSRLTRREFNTLDLIGRLSQRMGHDLSGEQIAELAWLWYKPLSERATMEPGVRSLLQELLGRGLKLALVSNTFIPGQALDRHLDQQNLLDLLAVRVYSCDVTYRKPHPGIFQAALDRTGLAARNTMFVGDSLPADIVGAKRMGMVAVLKSRRPLPAKTAVRPDHQIAHLSQLREVLQQYQLPSPQHHAS